MLTMQKMWVGLKQFFRMAHRKLQETKYLTVHDAGMHYAKMVHGVVTGLQEVLQQEQSPIKTPVTISEPHKHVANVVQITHQQLSTRLHHMHTMIQAMQLQYAAAP